MRKRGKNKSKPSSKVAQKELKHNFEHTQTAQPSRTGFPRAHLKGQEDLVSRFIMGDVRGYYMVYREYFHIHAKSSKYSYPKRKPI